MKIVVESAGAQKGSLILVSNGRLLIEASDTVDSEEITVRQSIPVEKSQNLSPAIVNYVARTKESLVLDNAAQEGTFISDPYIQSNHTKSVLCMPILHTSRLIGILYLENNLATGAFTPQRQEVLKILAGQAAISLENALLYSNLRQEVDERKRAEEQIRRDKEFMRIAIDSLTHAFYVIDAGDYSVKMANEAADMGDLSGNPTCYALTHQRSKPCADPEHRCPLREVKKTKSPVSVEHIHYDKDGNARTIEVHCYPIFDSDGAVDQIIEYCLDITERKRVEKEVRKLNEELEKLRRVRKRKG
jgi:PAS domain-containing protein